MISPEFQKAINDVETLACVELKRVFLKLGFPEDQASLISSAPVLLHACKHGLESLENLLISDYATSSNPSPEKTYEVCIALRKAINFAEGKSE